MTIGLVVGCERERPAEPAQSEPPTAPAASAISSAEPCLPGATILRDAEPLVRLDVAGHDPSWVSVPRCASGPKPVVVAAHGHGGVAYMTCEDGRKMFGDRAFVLCVRGRQVPGGGETFADVPAFKREIDAAMAALEKRHAGHVDVARPLLMASSLGANLGRIAAVHDPDRFGRAIFVEGGNRGWTDATARAFRAGGERRILFACGTEACRRGAVDAERTLREAGVDVLVVYAPGAGHGFREIRDHVISELDWLLEGEPRFAPAPEAARP